MKKWPTLQLIEFTKGLLALAKRRDISSQADLARATGKKPSWISVVLAGNENLELRTMLDLVSKLDGTIHIAVTDKDERIKWVSDVIAMSERVPDLAEGWPVEEDLPVTLVFDKDRFARVGPNIRVSSRGDSQKFDERLVADA